MRHMIFISGLFVNDTPGRPGIHSNMTRAIAPYQLKHWLSQFGIRSQVIDFAQCLTVSEIIDLLDHFIGKETVAIGFTTSFWPFNGMPQHLIEVVRQVRERWPSLKVIAGGAKSPSNWRLPSSTGRMMFDRVFSGYSEDSLTDYIQELIGKRGLSLFNKKFDITKLAHRFDATDAIAPSEVLPVELGRGCIFKCKFCAHPNLGKSKLTYQRANELLVDELRWDHEQFGTTRFNYVDDTVNEDLEKVKNLSLIPKKLGFNLEWNGFLRADLVWAHDGAPEYLYESGLRSAFFGIETFNNAAGSAVGKGWAAKHGKAFLPKLHHDLWKGDVRIHLNMIAGLPSETMEQVRESAAWIKEQKVFSTRFVALHISQSGVEHAMSEFERNIEKYGYSMLGGENWTSDVCTRAEAQATVKTIMDDVEPWLPIGSWNLFGLLSLGIDRETAFSLTKADVDKLPYSIIHKFKTDYIKRLKAVAI